LWVLRSPSCMPKSCWETISFCDSKAWIYVVEASSYACRDVFLVCNSMLEASRDFILYDWASRQSLNDKMYFCPCIPDQGGVMTIGTRFSLFLCCDTSHDPSQERLVVSLSVPGPWRMPEGEWK
jgi:hypothetical protein